MLAKIFMPIAPVLENLLAQMTNLHSWPKIAVSFVNFVEDAKTWKTMKIANFLLNLVNVRKMKLT